MPTEMNQNAEWVLRWQHIRDGVILYVHYTFPDWGAVIDPDEAQTWPTEAAARAELERWEAHVPGITTEYGTVEVKRLSPRWDR